MTRAADVIASAKQQLGKPYVSPGSPPHSFDCSSLIQYTYRQFGISLPRVTFDQVKVGQPVAKGSQQPGDLIFSDWGEGPNSHVALYIGNNQVIEAPQPGENVMISSYSGSYVNHTNNIRRVMDAGGHPLDLAGVSTALAPTGSHGHASSAADKGPLGTLKDELGHIVDAFTSVDPLDGIRESIAGIGQSISAVGKLAEWNIKLFYPTTFVRLASGAAGTIFFLLGLVLLMGEVRDA